MVRAWLKTGITGRSLPGGLGFAVKHVAPRWPYNGGGALDGHEHGDAAAAFGGVVEFAGGIFDRDAVFGMEDVVAAAIGEFFPGGR